MSVKNRRFDGKTALVTGAASGIGKAIALGLAEEGGNLVLCDINEEGLAATGKAVGELGQKVVYLRCDMSDLAQIQNLAEAALTHFGVIDIVVNCAGVGETSMSFDEIDSDLWDKVYNTNLKGPFFLLQKLAGVMTDKEVKGRLINIASTEGKTNRGGSIAYASSKAGLIGLTQGLALQLAPFDITVNAVCPGLINTPIWHQADKKLELSEGSTIQMVAETAIESQMLKIMRVGEPEEVAAMVLFLASDDAAYITGQAVNVCGGLEFH
jgi:NAD(P)-dependent dehydrogenase (short-subunit alcohol dehydrogenase family)